MDLAHHVKRPLCSLFLIALCLLISLPLSAESIEFHFFGNSVEAGVIAIDGPITADIAEHLRAKLKEEGTEARRVVLNSNGGSLLGGIRLGRFIRQMGYSTEVGKLVPDTADPTGKQQVHGECYSACALAFLGGSYRQPESAPWLGFHQFHEGGASYSGYKLSPTEIRAEGLSQAQVISGMVVSYMVEMGADARLFTESSRAGPAELIRFTIEDAMQLGIVTPRPFSAWTLVPYKLGVVAASKRTITTGPYDLAIQSTAFCRSSTKTPSLMMTVKRIADLEADDLAEYAVYVSLVPQEGSRQQKETLTLNKVRAFGSGATLQVEVTLDNHLVSLITQSESFGMTLLVPRVLGGYSVSHVLSHKDREILGAAFRLCI
ncbi:hypothetical protein [Marinobacterium halophilum]|uniref:COG3904 family protein n=1 Tax=Marinobacterium halophilum TaxID=267374 RepID=UPI0011B28B14|nr:hypothetical protein [Marinobacterium halophilum]